MSEEDFDCIEAHLFIETTNGDTISQQEEETLFVALCELLDDRGLTFSGSMSNYSEDESEYVPEDELCETCGGTGRKTEEEPEADPEATERWNELYAPIAQLEEQSPPKGQVEGSSPSRSAIDVRNGCDRESDGESGDQGGPGDDRGDRERSEDPGGHHSGEDG
jgi:hypothetical protein